MNERSEKQQKKIDEIMAIPDRKERQKAIAQNLDLFKYVAPSQLDFAKGNYYKPNNKKAKK